VTGKADITVTPNARAFRGGETAQDLFSAEPRWMRNMLIKRTAMWLLALGVSIALGPLAIAQVPSNSNLDYQTPNPTYENGSAPFAESAPPSHRSIFPFHPVGFEPSWDWFGPAETSSYGNGPRSKVGFFASYERLYWSFAKPAASEIGSQTASFAFSLSGLTDNGVNTGWLDNAGAWGNRWELGYVDTDNYGWMVSVLDRVSQGQHSVVENALVQFDDPNNLLSGFLPSVDPVTGLIIDSDLNNNLVHGRNGLDLGRPNPLPPPPIFVPPPDGHPDTPAPTDLGDRIQWPVIYSLLDMKNITRLNGVEVMRMYRAPRLHNGGYFELLYGARYLQLDDTFKVYGTNSVTTVTTDIFTQTQTINSFVDLTNPLADSQWSQRAQNNMVGPQIGGRWSNQKGRWTTSLEARFLAAANFQSVHQKTTLGTNLLSNPNFNSFDFTLGGVINGFPNINLFHGFGTETHAYATTFAPVGELRVNVACNVTSNVALKFGYTGLVMGNITRASNRFDFSQANLISILPTGIHQTFFSNGINFGVEVNR
jgi:hypothetical protein